MPVTVRVSVCDRAVVVRATVIAAARANGANERPSAATSLRMLYLHRVESRSRAGQGDAETSRANAHARPVKNWRGDRSLSTPSRERRDGSAHRDDERWLTETTRTPSLATVAGVVVDALNDHACWPARRCHASDSESMHETGVAVWPRRRGSIHFPQPRRTRRSFRRGRRSGAPRAGRRYSPQHRALERGENTRIIDPNATVHGFQDIADRLSRCFERVEIQRDLQQPSPQRQRVA